MKKDIEKGWPGYVAGVKKKNIRYSIIGVIVFVSFYIIGYVAADTNANYLTIVAMLAILPTAQFMTRAFAYGRFHSVDDSFANEVEKMSNRVTVLSEIILVRKKNTCFFENVLITQDNVLVVSNKKRPKAGKSKSARDSMGEKTLDSLFRQHGISVTVKAFDDELDLYAYFNSNVKPTLQIKDEEKQLAIAELILKNAM
jgi:hypothetical protein